MNKTEIASNALLLLGDKYIADLNEDSDRAQLVRSLYDQCRDAVIRAHTWGCCTKRVILSPMSTAPEFEWGYQFQLPSDCLRVIAIDFNGVFMDYKVEGKKVLADTNVLYLRYLFQNDDPSSYDAGFCDVLVARLAAEMAYPITKSASMKQQMDQAYLFKLRQARSADGQEGVTDDWADSPLVQVR